jgi:hypothetical protein
MVTSWISICPSAKLAIELDGGGYNYRAGQTRDQTRSEFLARHGVFVLRFWNHQVRQELNSVLRVQSGSHSRSDRKIIPHLHPLPLAKERRGPRSARRVSQQEHHRTRTFQVEYRELLRRHGVDFDERYVWD